MTMKTPQNKGKLEYSEEELDAQERPRILGGRLTDAVRRQRILLLTFRATKFGPKSVWLLKKVNHTTRNANHRTGAWR